MSETGSAPARPWVLVVALLVLMLCAFLAVLGGVGSLSSSDGVVVAGGVGLLLSAALGVVAVVGWWRDRPWAWWCAAVFLALMTAFAIWDSLRRGGTFVRVLPPAVGLLAIFTPLVRRHFGVRAPSED